ncbi:hypothetical protein BOTBODRAFT_45854 [Botryobasidium botryosum FD-172 SS1]|uniref:SAM domain-containing protein n=1 Tax=Botryobasidium botryosum (strain FD-172 SS1) TaxID=930990 RepID=A0A067MAD1_BOTB1|nr:hypothetical protein BOTBODRAFT_45854 [Botryobasidium botryosum FD-172 SS1]
MAGRFPTSAPPRLVLPPVYPSEPPPDFQWPVAKPYREITTMRDLWPYGVNTSWVGYHDEISYTIEEVTKMTDGRRLLTKAPDPHVATLGHVHRWLRLEGLGEYATLLGEIEWTALLRMDSVMLRKAGVTDDAARMKMLGLFPALRSRASIPEPVMPSIPVAAPPPPIGGKHVARI